MRLTCLADLKRIPVGTKIKLVASDRPSHPSLGVEREITKVQTNAIVIGKNWLNFPKAALLEFTGKGFKVYVAGERELTKAEKEIIANEPRDAKQEEIDALSDGSIMFFRQKRYYAEHNAEYLFIGDKHKRLVHKAGDVTKVVDDNVKGALVLEYEIVEEAKVAA